MKRCLIFFILAVSAITALADNRIKDRDTDAYPPGYYDGDPVPEKTAYLTFDDGPSDWTEGILDVLKNENVKGTFFISAWWNNRNRSGKSSFLRHKKALQRTIKEGHLIGNHTADHRVLTRLSKNSIIKQFSANQDLLDSVLGKDSPRMTLLRPPLGQPWHKRFSEKTKARVGAVVKNIGSVISWTARFDSTDSWRWSKGEWFRNGGRINFDNPAFRKKVQYMHDRILSGADGRGMVILFHDTHPTTMFALSSVIKDLRGKGYSFGTMEEYMEWKYGRRSGDFLQVNSSP